MKYSDREIENAMEMYEPILQKSLDKGISIQAMAGRISQEL